MRSQEERKKQARHVHDTVIIQGACTADSTVLAWLIRPTVGQVYTMGLYTLDYSEQLWFSLNEIHQPYRRVHTSMYIVYTTEVRHHQCTCR